MSGSRLDFQYKDDNQSPWALQLDESNTKLTNSSSDIGTMKEGTERLPPNVKPRHIVLANKDRTLRRKCVILSTLRFAAITNSQKFVISIDNVSTDFFVISKLGERKLRIPMANDSGQTDGSPDDNRVTTPPVLGPS